MKNVNNKQLGFSLLEVFIALGLGALMTAAVITFFAGNKVNYNIQQGLAQLQENGRFAEYMLTQDLRMAGYQGCTNTAVFTPNNIVTPASAAPFGPDDIITGYQSTGASSWSPNLPGTLTGVVQGGTDVIVVRKAAPVSTHLSDNMASPAADIEVDNKIAFQNNEILMITDCEDGDIFRATSVSGAGTMSIGHGTAGNATGDLSKAYQTDAHVAQFESFTYFIRDTGRTNQVGQPILALVRQDINGTNEELVDGVEDMQIVYGIDTSGNGSADTYLTADQVQAASNWPNVISVNINLLLATVEDVSQDEVPYTFNGTTVNNPGDRKIRRQWSTFITVRNRGV